MSGGGCSSASVDEQDVVAAVTADEVTAAVAQDAISAEVSGDVIDVSIDDCSPVATVIEEPIAVSIDEGDEIVVADPDSGITAEVIEESIVADVGCGPGGSGGSANSAGTLEGTYKSASALSSLRIVKQNTDGRVSYASSNDVAHAAPVLGMTLTAVSSPDEDVKVCTEGPVSDGGWSWTPNLPLFLGLNGNLTQTPPSSGNYLLRVGFAATPTSIFLRLAPPILR